MKDVAPELLAVLQEDFRRRFNASTHIKKLNARLSAGEATYEEAHAYAIEVGEMLAAVYGDNLSSDVLPDGKMYFNIAERVIKPTMKQNYELISAYSAEVQELLNEKAGLHLGAVKPKFNENRVDGIVERLSGEDDFDKAKWLLGEPVENFSQAVVDDTVKANVEIQYNAGLSPKVVRKGRSDGCSWCKALAGSYAYPDVPKDIYRRHEYCRCLVEYHPGDGRRQNVHTKKWVDPEQAQKIEQRKVAGLPEANTEKVAERIMYQEHERERIMQTELGEFSKSIEPVRAVSEEYHQAVREKFSHGSKFAKRAFNRFVGEDSVADYFFTGVAHFNPTTNKIMLNWSADLTGNNLPGAIWFHEHGHMIDYMANNLSHDDIFESLLKEDYNRYVQMIMHKEKCDITRAHKIIEEGVLDIKKHSAVSDILEGVTKGEILGVSGHMENAENYWNKKYALTEEAFAHMFEAQFDETRYKEMKKYFPKSLEYMENKLKAVAYAKQ